MSDENLSPAEEMVEPFEEVVLGGKTRRLHYGFNVFCEIQELNKANPFEDASALLPNSPATIRKLVWAGLYEERPRPTLEQVGAWLNTTWPEVAAAMTRLIQRTSAQKSKEKGGKKRPQ